MELCTPALAKSARGLSAEEGEGTGVVKWLFPGMKKMKLEEEESQEACVR
jgi:hypothetical protein